MSHIVIYESDRNEPIFQVVDTVSAAADVVEMLRNSDGVQNAHIFRMEEVEFGFRPYYHIEIADSAEETTETISEPVDERAGQTEPAAEPETETESKPVAAIWAEALSADAVGTDPAMPPEPGMDHEYAAAGENGHRGLFGR